MCDYILLLELALYNYITSENHNLILDKKNQVTSYLMLENEVTTAIKRDFMLYKPPFEPFSKMLKRVEVRRLCRPNHGLKILLI